MLSFQVFGSTISLIYNPAFKGISQVSRMVRFWKERILEKEQKRDRKVWNSYIGSMTPYAFQIVKTWLIDVKHCPLMGGFSVGGQGGV
jgi:hypothetical protein